MNFLQQTSEVNYFPSRFSQVHESLPFAHDTTPLVGLPVRQNIPLTDDFNQAGDRWRSFDVDRQTRFAKRVAATLSAARVTADLRTIWYGYWTQADPNLSKLIQSMVHQILVLKDPEMVRMKQSVMRAASGTSHE